ncbi:hypothetical protein L1887_11658 [Cichorium endivia]|nr:hypothetical protein L1887_11658 [Cichorium endivia]
MSSTSSSLSQKIIIIKDPLRKSQYNKYTIMDLKRYSKQAYSSNDDEMKKVNRETTITARRSKPKFDPTNGSSFKKYPKESKKLNSASKWNASDAGKKDPLSASFFAFCSSISYTGPIFAITTTIVAISTTGKHHHRLVPLLLIPFVIFHGLNGFLQLNATTAALPFLLDKSAQISAALPFYRTKSP